MADQILLQRGYSLIVLLTFLALGAWASTDHANVIALQHLYKTMNFPPQLKGWSLDRGDPCRESWSGVLCFGSSVIHLKLQGLNLHGFLGSQLHFRHSLKYLGVSSNYIEGKIPFSLPPNATHINLASNKLRQSIPHSLPSLKSLRHLNLSHNSLSGPIGNVFSGPQNLKEIDLSYNNFTGHLPTSMGSLPNLTILFLQFNQFSGSFFCLADLPLEVLNIKSNHFSGFIPPRFQVIPNLWIDGNSFLVGPAYPTAKSAAIENKKQRLGLLGVVVLVGAEVAMVVTAIVMAFMARMKSHARGSTSGAGRGEKRLTVEEAQDIFRRDEMSEIAVIQVKNDGEVRRLVDIKKNEVLTFRALKRRLSDVFMDYNDYDKSKMMGHVFWPGYTVSGYQRTSDRHAKEILKDIQDKDDMLAKNYQPKWSVLNEVVGIEN